MVDPNGFTSVEVVLGKLAEADWRNWHSAEVSAVDEALDFLWEATLDRQNAGGLANDVLCGIARTGRDIQPLLGIWLEKSDGPAAEQLASFIDWHVPSLLEKKTNSAGFWDDVPDQHQKVIDWLKSPEAREFIRSSSALSAEDREQSLWLLGSLVSAEG